MPVPSGHFLFSISILSPVTIFRLPPYSNVKEFKAL